MTSAIRIRDLLLMVFWLAGIHARSQPMVKGFVHDVEQKPVPFCNVFVERDGVIRQLSTTNERGLFILQPIDTGTFRLVATFLGYKKHAEFIRVLDVPLEVDITLLPDTVLLEQVIVHDEGPIRTKGDTVIYDATFFATGNEAVLGDILKKLPGVTVADDGKVKYRGKEVTKIKVEDDDLFDRNYPILTKNLSADLVEQVEILQNYSDNRLLKNIEDSDEVAINLKLKKDRKQELFGDARGESNFHDRYEARANLISFTKKLKLYALGSANSTGTDPTGDVEDLLQPGTLSRVPGGVISSDYLVPVAKPYIDEFKRDRYFFNQAFFGSLNGVYRPSEKVRLTLNGYQYRDKNNFLRTSRTEYYTPTDTVQFDELAQTDNQERFGLLQAMVEYDASPSMSLRYKFRLNTQNGTVQEYSNLNQNDIREQLASEAVRSDHLLTATRKLSANTAVTLDVRYLSDQRPQTYFVDGNLLNPYFNTTSSDTLQQSNDLPTTFLGGELNLYTKARIGKYGLRIGFERTEQIVNSRLGSGTSELASNDLATKQKKGYGEGYFAWQVKHFTFTPGIGIQYVDIYVADRQTSPYLFINPRLGVKWQLSTRSRISVVYAISQPTSTASQLTTSPVLKDYNVLSINDNGFRTFPSRSVVASYEMGNWISLFSLSAILYHHEVDADYLVDTNIEPNYLVSTMNQVANRKNSSFTLVLDKFLKPLRSNLKINASYNRSEFTTSTESVAVETVSNNYRGDLSLRSALNGPFNAHVGHILQVAATQNGFINAENYSSLFYVDGYITGFNARLNITLHAERFELLSLDQRPVFHFVDFTARYALSSGQRLTLLLKGRNLLDERTFAQRFVSSQSVATTANQLIPRYVLVGLEFRF